MTGPEHYREAERSLAAMNGKGHAAVNVLLAEAQVHATLALTAATALAVAHDMPVADHDAWWAAAGAAGPVHREVTP